MARNFKDPRRKAAYQVARAHHAAVSRRADGVGAAYRVGYAGQPSRFVRTSIAYAYWAAGVDNRRTHIARRASR